MGRYYEPEKHRMDTYPIPRDEAPLFVNEPWVFDQSIYCETINDHIREPDGCAEVFPFELIEGLRKEYGFSQVSGENSGVKL